MFFKLLRNTLYYFHISIKTHGFCLVGESKTFDLHIL